MTAPTGYIVAFHDRDDGKWSTLDGPLPQTLDEIFNLLIEPSSWADSIYIGKIGSDSDYTDAVMSHLAESAAEQNAHAGFVMAERPEWLWLSRAANNAFHYRLDELEQEAYDRAEHEAAEREQLHI